MVVVVQALEQAAQRQVAYEELKRTHKHIQDKTQATGDDVNELIDSVPPVLSVP